MPMTFNPQDYGKVLDMTSSINLVPNTWGLINRLGLFEDKYGKTKTVMIPRTTETDNLLVDRNWDERNPSIAGGARDYITFPIPHFPVDDAITPNDIDANVDWDSLLRGGMELETIAQKRVEKQERIRKAHALTLELARMELLKDGSVYSPSGTVNINYYSAYGLTRQVIPVDLASTTVDPKVAIEGAIGYLQDALLTGDVATDFIAIASPEFFSALTSNAFINEKYFYVQNSQQQPLLVDRLTAGSPLDARYRTFSYGDVTFIEMRGSVKGVPYVEPDKAYMFPRGTSAFETHYAPANRLSTINKTAQQSYLFEYFNRKDDIIELMSETNFLNILKRPDMVITLSNE